MTFSRGSSTSLSPVAFGGCGGRDAGLRRSLGRVVFDPHDPAALQLAFGLQEHRACLLQEFEGVRPEVQPQDVALPRQQVVVDVEPAHRFEVAPDDPVGDEGGEVRCVVAAVLDLVQRGGPNLEAGLVLLVPLRHAGVEVPAVVVEPRRVRDRSHFCQPLAFELPEADSDVGYLHAGIVDVVLDFDLAAEESQQTAEGVAERGVAQVPDVRGLVRVDGRVLDDRLPVASRRRRAPGIRRRTWREPAGELRGAIEEEVDVAVRRRFDAREAIDGAERADDLLRDGAGRLAQPARQLEGERDRQVTERAARRNLDRNRGKNRIVCGNVVETPDGVCHVASNGVLDW